MPTTATPFAYRLHATPEGWSWRAFDPGGAVEAQGVAPTRAVAAACIVRALADRALRDRKAPTQA